MHVSDHDVNFILYFKYFIIFLLFCCGDGYRFLMESDHSFQFHHFFDLNYLFNLNFDIIMANFIKFQTYLKQLSYFPHYLFSDSHLK